ncbi:MAG: ankyrin repeat domain-containing protein [bacterium]|nr:ankyrin repeat domain-containing protein [bacterium]
MSDAGGDEAALAEAVARGDVPATARALARLRACGWQPAVIAGQPSLLHRAVSSGLPGARAVAELMLRAGHPIDARGPGGLTPLHQAIAHGADEVAAWLVDRGARVDLAAADGRAALTMAIAAPGPHEGRRTTLIQRLLAAAAPPPEELRMLLHAAVRQQSPSVVETLLASGADAAAAGADGETALHALAERATIGAEAPTAILDLLLRHGAALEARDAAGRTALHRATRRDSTIVAALLLDRGAELEARTADGSTPLLVAGEYHDMVDLLLARGADAGAVRDDGRTALHVAAAEGRLETVRRMAGVAAALADRSGETPLHVVSGEMAAAIVDALVTAGAAPNARTTSGLTPLHTAALGGELAAVTALLARGADVNARSTAPGERAGIAIPSGATVLDLAELEADGPVSPADVTRRRVAEVLRERGGVRGGGIFGRVRRFLGG